MVNINSNKMGYQWHM